MKEDDDAVNLTPDEAAALFAITGTLEEIRELPCAICGDTGDTYPCIRCDMLVCGECGEGVRWCKEHYPNDY